ncbi:hypothetical protein PACTADRAFT_44494 [Pachysolen tannophilus NRRL Y-2460]|uniref:GTP:AMP phosphotransferase, mitochondrial n=1 Tax=Pachysolen tannophilus NRRL Y-2460 TaxID=669874 RepID=A0A1E4TRE3_PACTA|nr:hypothetical protein PACTADRAFT_44494 [Pachysolen tannophilus NRRL Y-2460]
MSLTKPLRLLLLGAPGSGKGTQTSKLLAKIPTLTSISSGDLLRKEISIKSSIGKTASKYIEKGDLLPDSIILDLIYKELSDKNWLSPNATWLLDGFPRTLNQAIGLDNRLSKHNVNINLVVELDIPEDVILQRVENRWVHIPSGRVYNTQYNPPKIPGKDDITGENLSKRPDDNAQVFKQRLQKYHNEITPLKKFYENQNILHKVSGETSDIIFPKLYNLIISKFGKS